MVLDETGYRELARLAFSEAARTVDVGICNDRPNAEMTV